VVNKGDNEIVSEIAIRITNSSRENMMLHLEPWGEQYTMSVGATFKVEAEGPDGDILELEFADGRLVVWGWSGSVVKICEAVREGSDQQDFKP
jgi:hypothetical protein